MYIIHIGAFPAAVAVETKASPIRTESYMSFSELLVEAAELSLLMACILSLHYRLKSLEPWPRNTRKRAMIYEGGFLDGISKLVS